MTKTNLSNRINDNHLQRKAIIYIRQSTEKQVKHNKESRLLQYDLKNRALDLGWKEIEIIDCDLGMSAAPGKARRIGFDRLIASVAIGEVGIVMSRELSRLIRSDKDWCRLVEVCQLFDTLIGDDSQVYDPNCMDDQLLLGIKGTISIIELKILQKRLLAGMEAKAKRGEFKRLTPPGYIWDTFDKVVKDPDEGIQNAISLIFKKFREIQSVRQTFLWFHSQNIELPVNKVCTGMKKIVWQLPKNAFVKDVLQNPFFAGAYVWGRREIKIKFKDGNYIKQQGKHIDPEKAKVFIKEHHEGYIDWETYKENQVMIRNNCLNLHSDESAGAVREGQGLLSGLLRCGRCGKKLYVRYWGKSGTSARYVCKGDFDSGGKYCLAFGGGTVDKEFSKELLKAISPFGIDASINAIEVFVLRSEEKIKIVTNNIKQLQYETDRAFEQYNEVDPKNRLVAGELERRWNVKLEELEKTRKEMEVFETERKSITEDDKERIKLLGKNFSLVWNSEQCPNSMKKKIIRTVIDEIIVNLDDDSQMLKFIIHWKGDCHTEFIMPKPKSAACQKTSLKALEIIRKMSIRYGDDRIASVLNKLGHKTGKGKRWSVQSVRSARSRYSISGQRKTINTPHIYNLAQAAKYLDVSETTIKRLTTNGLLKKDQIVPWSPWEIKKSDLDSETIKNIIFHLKETGRLDLKRHSLSAQKSLFTDI